MPPLTELAILLVVIHTHLNLEKSCAMLSTPCETCERPRSNAATLSTVFRSVSMAIRFAPAMIRAHTITIGERTGAWCAYALAPLLALLRLSQPTLAYGPSNRYTWHPRHSLYNLYNR